MLVETENCNGKGDIQPHLNILASEKTFCFTIPP